MPTPANVTVYTATLDAMGVVALALLVELLGTVVRKGALTWEDVDPILTAATQSQVGPTQRQAEARRVIQAIREMLG